MPVDAGGDDDDESLVGVDEGDDDEVYLDGVDDVVDGVHLAAVFLLMFPPLSPGTDNQIIHV